ncbi:MAG: universal stress protein [Acidimicrobiales bacterium]
MSQDTRGGQHKIVVGVDGSDGARSALLWAAAEAMRRGAPLDVVHSWLAVGEHAAAQRVAEDGASAVSLIYPGVHVTTSVTQQPPAQALVEASADAELLVVGSRGLGGFRGLMLGSVSAQCVEHARCPVVVARDRPIAEEPRNGMAAGGARIVVGVDGSPGSAVALRWSVDEAVRHQATLMVVCAWQPTPLGGYMVPPTEGYQRAADEILSEAVADVHHQEPDVKVEVRGEFGAAVQVLVDAAREAQLLVVGARGHGGFTGLLLGSTSQAAVRHALCPVAVVRPAPARSGDEVATVPDAAVSR